MGQVYLVRHGQASFGSRDYDRLSPLGEEQGRMLGRWFSEADIVCDRVVTGGLRRHLQTAEAFLAVQPHPTVPVSQDSGFDEFDFLDVLRCYRPDLASHDSIRGFLAASDDPRRAFQTVFSAAVLRWAEGGHDSNYRESWGVFRDRCIAAFRRQVETAAPSGSTIIFTSGGPIAAICQHLLGLSNAVTVSLNNILVNSGVTRVVHDRQRASLLYLNNFAHLEAAGDKSKITNR
ncbi:histidine phosphatase family protein [Magnetospirillum molischianum]|uniref:Phosphoglycerate mutase n=1 Tax=Magnetospirillum molischianum DSM 120 TaxID=1150626 RepID=H8FSA5_MAGML|nr:histidine phosphatase family protein [Magnetospirillum molischianum]CCG41243.1 Phosphoglycerate mutase [Magnetospirillum molischianum DSM 120]